MAQSADRPTPRGAWGFLGGYFLFFIGWMAGLIGSIQLLDVHKAADPAQQLLIGYALVGAAVFL